MNELVAFSTGAVVALIVGRLFKGPFWVSAMMSVTLTGIVLLVGAAATGQL